MNHIYLLSIVHLNVFVLPMHIFGKGPFVRSEASQANYKL